MATLQTPRKGTAGVMTLKNGDSCNYGADGTENGLFCYYTGQGLREIFSQKTEDQRKIASDLQKKGKEELIASGHYARTPLSDILMFA